MRAKQLSVVPLRSLVAIKISPPADRDFTLISWVVQISDIFCQYTASYMYKICTYSYVHMYYHHTYVYKICTVRVCTCTCVIHLPDIYVHIHIYVRMYNKGVNILYSAHIHTCIQRYVGTYVLCTHTCTGKHCMLQHTNTHSVLTQQLRII